MSDGPVLAKGSDDEVRSAMTAGLNVKLPPADDPASMAEARRIIDQYRSIQRFYEGDDYPLTPYSTAPDAWLAYQLDLGEGEEGIMVVLKRPGSAEASKVLKPRALDPVARYRLVDLDGRPERVLEGRAVPEGLEVRLERAPDSAVIRYRRER